MEKIKILLFLLLLPLAAIGQASVVDALTDTPRDTFVFDYSIRIDGSDQLVPGRGTVIFSEDFVFVQLASKQILRTVIGQTKSQEGERIFRFANGDGLRLTTFAGSVDGCFLQSADRSFYFGKDSELKDSIGWTNKF